VLSSIGAVVRHMAFVGGYGSGQVRANQCQCETWDGL
jgi:hypothetical protein